MGSRTTLARGQSAEQRAFEHLVDQGLNPVDRNFHCRGGEIDLIMLDQTCLVFVEVRYRASKHFGRAQDTVDRHKQRKIIRTAAFYISRNPDHGSRTMRFDVVAIEGDELAEEQLTWIKDAFRPNNSTL